MESKSDYEIPPPTNNDIDLVTIVFTGLVFAELLVVSKVVANSMISGQ